MMMPFMYVLYECECDAECFDWQSWTIQGCGDYPTLAYWWP